MICNAFFLDFTRRRVYNYHGGDVMEIRKGCLRTALLLWVLFVIIKAAAVFNAFYMYKGTQSREWHTAEDILFKSTPLTFALKSRSVTLLTVGLAADLVTVALLTALMFLDKSRLQRALFIVCFVLGLTYVLYLVLLPFYMAISAAMPMGAEKMLPALLPAIAVIFYAKCYKKA